ncbi:lysophospholipid acyltransferase family protein [Desulfocurvus sp. DL9XJH121]
MHQAQPLDNPFNLDLPLYRPVKAVIQPPLEKLLCLSTLGSLYSQISGREGADFLSDVLDLLAIRVDLAEGDLANIPAAGGAVVVANHPFGAIEGVILLQALRRVRPDVKVMANHLLGMIPEMRDHIIAVDPFGKDSSTKRNISGLRQAIRWVRGGGLLAVFPAGEVSSLQLRKASFTDPPWSSSVGSLIRIAKAPVVPVHFQGKNGLLFHLLGLIHPRLRTALLPREMLNKRCRAVRLDVGRAVPVQKLERFEDDAKLTEFLRLRTYLLRERGAGQATVAALPAAAAKAQEPVAPSCGPDLLEAEIAALPESCRLLIQGDYTVVCARGRDLAFLLPEIGRLREENFREVGEGTGQARDLDRFDDYYHHLILWNAAEREIAGAYRLGRADEIARTMGARGLYTSTLFKYDRAFLAALGPCLELGRAFVAAKYRKNYNPLMLLWKGIARFVLMSGDIRTLFGPVSISNDYRPLSRNMMMRFLSARHRLDAAWAGGVRPLVPPRLHTRLPGGFRLGSVAALCPDIEDLGAAVADIEADGKGIPILLRQYLKLGGTVLTFNLDREFGDAIDGLMVVDLAKAPARTLARYMGKDEAEAFMARHGADAATAARPAA